MSALSSASTPPDADPDSAASVRKITVGICALELKVGAGLRGLTGWPGCPSGCTRRFACARR